MKTTVSILLILMALAIAGLASVPRINAWEKANNYPYGKLCDLYRSCN